MTFAMMFATTFATTFADVFRASTLSMVTLLTRSILGVMFASELERMIDDALLAPDSDLVRTSHRAPDHLVRAADVHRQIEMN